MFIRQLFIFSFLFISSACVIDHNPDFIPSSYFIKDRFPDNKHAIVITKTLNGNSNWSFIPNENQDYVKSKKINLTSYSINASGERGSYDVYLLPPGAYSLNYYSYDKYYSYLKDNVILWDSEEKQGAMASFIVKPGEILYIGSLSFSRTGVRLLDSYVYAKEFFQKKYPFLKKKQITKRLVSFKENNKE